MKPKKHSKVKYRLSLQRCPFCGGLGTVLPWLDTYYVVECGDCDAQGPIARTRGWAKRKWNWRAKS